MPIPLVLTGFRHHLEFVKSMLPKDASRSVLTVDEEQAADVVPEMSKVKAAVYVFGIDTEVSSLLGAAFVRIRQILKPPKEYLLGVDGVDPHKHVSWYWGGTLQNAPVITVDDLLEKIRERP